jgi:isoamylase
VLSLGTPMMLAGDELGNTQQGNNNPYCQDDEIGWMKWPDPNDAAKWQLFDFVRVLIALRRKYRLARVGKFLRGTPVPNSEHRDVTWLRPDGAEMTGEDWSYPEARFLALLLWGELPIRHGLTDAEIENDAPLILVLNAHHDDMEFKIPPISAMKGWAVVFDTAVPSGLGRPERLSAGQPTTVKGRSVAVLVGTMSEPLSVSAPP